jgi:hypothetical protein
MNFVSLSDDTKYVKERMENRILANQTLKMVMLVQSLFEKVNCEKIDEKKCQKQKSFT